jgi:hypothetical protein
MADARYVRALAQRLTKKEHVNPPFHTDVFDVQAAEEAPVRVLYKLSEVDEFARKNPNEKVMGYISVIVTEVHVVSNFKRNMLMSTECCGLPIFANVVKAKCRQCEKEAALRINPRIVSLHIHIHFHFHTSVRAVIDLRIARYRHRRNRTNRRG